MPKFHVDYVIDQNGMPLSDVHREPASGQFLLHVHNLSHCRGEFCTVHKPSPHHMREWRIGWRSDAGQMERLCPHGIGHPDPDESKGGAHGCDGCCRPPVALETT